MVSEVDRNAAAAETAPPESDDKPVTPHVREHYEAIREKEQEVRRLESIFFDVRRAAKNAKENFEAADQELRTLIADGFDPQSKLPFPAEPAVNPEAWRSALLSE